MSTAERGMASIVLNGARIACQATGAGETVILLHGSAGAGSHWRALAGGLAARFRLLIPDLYGHGDSDPWPGPRPLTLADEAALVAAVLGAPAGAIHLVGHSYGAAVALRFALERPAALASLTLIEPVAFHLLRWTAPRGRSPLAEIAPLAAGLAADAAAGMARFVDYWNGEGSWSGLTAEKQAALASRAAAVAAHFAAVMGETVKLDGYRGIAAPTLLLGGARTRRPTRLIARRLARAIPGARLRRIAEAGHMLPLTHPEAVAAALADHLQAAAPRRAAA